MRLMDRPGLSGAYLPSLGGKHRRMQTMRTLGIVGGIGPESTIAYYRQIIALYRDRTRDGSYPPVVINSIDVAKMLGMIGVGDLAGVTDYLVEEVKRLAGAG